jgi:hypothetical protein
MKKINNSIRMTDEEIIALAENEIREWKKIIKDIKSKKK